jgi:leader peptidase (prepilin peptidase)/N-methyltransferase
MVIVVAIFSAVLGLIVGSFINVVVHRVPRHESVLAPRSQCPACATQIRNRDNVPILSWLALRGRCRACATPISMRYPLVEAAGGGIFLAAALRTGVNWNLPPTLALLGGLLALALIDLEHHLLPKRIVYPVLVIVSALIVLGGSATGEWRRILIALICASTWFGLFFFINLISPRSLGFGDVRLAFLLGLALGWLGAAYAVLGFFAANASGALVGVALIATKRIERDTAIPYGVFLAVGALIAIVAAPTGFDGLAIR